MYYDHKVSVRETTMFVKRMDVLLDLCDIVLFLNALQPAAFITPERFTDVRFQRSPVQRFVSESTEYNNVATDQAREV